jgi:malate dehydrogenase (oxaloacetate-decarboxylating)
MIMAAAKALALQSPAREDATRPLLPPVADSRKVSLLVAEAVGRQAIADGVSPIAADSLKDELLAYVWEPVYLPYERID